MADKDQDIKVLTEIEHCLKRSQLYVGSTSLQKQEFWIPKEDKLVKSEIEYCPALFKIFSEIIDNSSDEINVRGYGDTINIEYNFDEGEYKVSDNGRGIPIEKHKESGKFFPELVFAQLRAGSNFDDSARKTSGMNGVGATLTTIFSEFLFVKIKREGKVYEQSFKDNLSKISPPKIEKNDKQKGTGTTIYFKPDYKIFKEKLPICLVQKRCLELTVMYNKLTINLRIIKDGKQEDISYKNRKFEEFVKMFDTTFTVYEDNKTNTKLAICNNKMSENFEFFSNINGVDTFRGGNHVESVKEIFCESIKEKIYKELKLEVTNQDIAKHMIVVLFQIWNAPQFEGQTKEKFVNDKKEVKQFFDEILSSRRITSMFSDLEDMKKAIIDDVNAKNERKNLLELKSIQKNIDRKKIPKLLDCSSRDRLKCAIYITEGDSAIANLASVRDSKLMAGLPLRGKILNVMECNEKEVLANKEIQSLMSAIGLKIGQSPIELKLGKIEKCNLNYGRIVIATDQDMDGYSIRCLLVNFFYKYWPELIKYGFVYILESPLYEVVENKDGIANYFYNKEEYEDFMSGKHTNSSKYSVSYFKGLGSCGNEGWDYMINKKPNLIQVTDPNSTESVQKLKLAFGDDSDPRKKWLM